MLKDDRLDQLDAPVQTRIVDGTEFEVLPLTLFRSSSLLGGTLTPEPDYRAVKNRSDRISNRTHQRNQVSRDLGK